MYRAQGVWHRVQQIRVKYSIQDWRNEDKGVVYLSCLVLSCLFLSCLVLSYLILSYLVLSCLVLTPPLLTQKRCKLAGQKTKIGRSRNPKNTPVPEWQKQASIFFSDSSEGGKLPGQASSSLQSSDIVTEWHLLHSSASIFFTTCTGWSYKRCQSQNVGPFCASFY